MKRKDLDLDLKAGLAGRVKRGTVKAVSFNQNSHLSNRIIATKKYQQVKKLAVKYRFQCKRLQIVIIFRYFLSVTGITSRLDYDHINQPPAQETA